MTEDVFQEWSRLTVGYRDVTSLDKLKDFILNEFDDVPVLCVTPRNT